MMYAIEMTSGGTVCTCQVESEKKKEKINKLQCGRKYSV
jgi:hypothetical protein